MAKKSLRKYNLDLTDTYKLVNSFHTDDFCFCENCNRPINNVGVLLSSQGVTYSVGMDCAATLTNLDDHDPLVRAFKEVQSARSNMNRRIKKGERVWVEFDYDGRLYIYCEGGWIARFDQDFVSNYWSKLFDMAINPDKKGFNPFLTSDFKSGNNYIDFKDGETREIVAGSETVTVTRNGRDFILTLGELKKKTFFQRVDLSIYGIVSEKKFNEYQNQNI